MTDATVENDKPEAQGHGDGQGEDNQPMQLDRSEKESNDEEVTYVQPRISVKDDVQDGAKQHISRMKPHQGEHSPKCDKKSAVKGNATSPKRDLKKSASGGRRRALRRASISTPRSADSSPNSRFVEKTASGTGGGRVKRRSSLGGVVPLPEQGTKSSTFQCAVIASGIRKPTATEKITDNKTNMPGPLFAPAKFLLEDEDDSKHSVDMEDLEQKSDKQHVVEPKINERFPIYELKDGGEFVASAEFEPKEEKHTAILAAAAGGNAWERQVENNLRDANDCYSDALVEMKQHLAEEEPNVFDANFEMTFVENDNAGGHIEEVQNGMEEKRKGKQQKNMDRSHNRSDSSRRSRSRNNYHQKEDSSLTTAETKEASDGSECSDGCQETGRLDALLQFDFNAPGGKHFAPCNNDDASIFRMNSIRTLTAPDCTTIRLNDFDKQLLDIKNSDYDKTKKKEKKGFTLAPKIFRKSRKNKDNRGDALDETAELETNGDKDNEEGENDDDDIVKIGADASETNGIQEKRNFEKERIRRIRTRDRAKHRDHDGGIDKNKSKDSDSDWVRKRSSSRTKRDSDRIGNRSGRTRDRTTAKECERVRYDENKPVAKNTETSRGILLNRNAQNAHRKERKHADTELTRDINEMKELDGVSTLTGGENDVVKDDGMKDISAGNGNVEKNDCRDSICSYERGIDSEKVGNNLDGGQADSTDERDNGNEVCESLHTESDGINSEEAWVESRPEGCDKEENNKADKEKNGRIISRRVRDRAALKKAASTRVVPTRTKSNDSGLKTIPSICHVSSIRRRTHQAGSIPKANVGNVGWARSKSFGDDSDVASPVTTSTRKQLLSVRKAQSVRQVPALTQSGDGALNPHPAQRRRCYGARDSRDLDRSMDRSMDRSREHSDMDKSGSNRRRRYSRRNGDMGDSSEGGRGMDRSENYSDMDKSGSGRKRHHTRRCREMDEVQEERGESPIRGVRGSLSMRAERSELESSFPAGSELSKSNLRETCYDDAYDDKATSKVQKKSFMKKTLDKSSAIGKGAKKFIKRGARNMEKRTLLIDDEDYSSE